MAEEEPFTMTVDMAVLESLGINLYSNAAAVLSELVANAYDADATLVEIEWNIDESMVIVKDDGCGMTERQLDKRFLTTGYQKRVAEGERSTKWERPFMGRKGIGKLSVFSIADEILVYSKRNRKSTGCKILADKLKKHIRDGKIYHPGRIDVPDEFDTQGTTIVLKQLKSKRVKLTAAALRKRLARRFDVIDQTPREEGGFKISIDGNQLTFTDREEFKRLEYLWEFGKPSLPDDGFPKLVKRFVLENDTVDRQEDWKVQGWIGTAQNPSDLSEDEEAGSLKNIMILARKRPIHEGIIDKLDFSRVFGNYVTGQIEADFLDVGNKDDIATSDRQRLIEDDPRVTALQQFLREAFYKASEKWTTERPKRKAADAYKEYPQLKEWRDGLEKSQRTAADKMIGTIASLPMEKRNERSNRVTLYRSGVLAFARIGLRNSAEDLQRLSTVSSDELLRFLGAQGEYEASLWADILRGRVEGIQKLDDLVEQVVYEKKVRNFLYDNLWLLDPGWERATGSAAMEKSLRKIEPDILAVDRKGKEIKGRIDIRYRNVSGSHVIVELKRPKRKESIGELIKQGTKYYSALKSVLRTQQRENQGISVVFVMSDDPIVRTEHKFASDADYIDHQMNPIGGRIVKYGALVANARSQYEEYLQASDKASELEALLASLEDDGATSR